MHHRDYHYRYQHNDEDDRLIDDIAKAINGEYNAIVFYDQLADMAHSKEEKKQIREIRQDELHHYRVFSRIYQELTGRHFTPKITEHFPNRYKPGLEFAIRDEQETVDFYLDIAEQAKQPYIKRQFQRAAADEQNHAVWFLYFYTKLCCD